MLPEQNGAYDHDLAAPVGNHRGVSPTSTELGNPTGGPRLKRTEEDGGPPGVPLEGVPIHEDG